MIGREMKQETVRGLAWVSVKRTPATDTVSIYIWFVLFLVRMQRNLVCQSSCVMQNKKKKRKTTTKKLLNLWLKHSAGAEYLSDYLVFTESVLTITEKNVIGS